MARQKLTPMQKEWLGNLIWFSKNIVSFYGNVEDLTDTVIAGKYAVFSTSKDSEGHYDIIIGAEDEHTYECQLRYNCYTHALVVDVDSLMVVRKSSKLMRPNFRNRGMMHGETNRCCDDKCKKQKSNDKA